MTLEYSERPLARAAMQVLWPGFVAAAVMVGIVFSVVDPLTIDFVHDNLGNSREAAYTVAFIVFWVIVSAACAMTWLLAS